MQSIQQFEKPRPAGYTQTAWDCRNQMLAKLAGHVPMQTAAPRQPMVHELPANQIASRLLTPKQAEGVEIVQKLCGHIHRATAQINTTLITYELPVGTIMVLAASGALGWGTYTLLTTLHVFEIISTQSWTPNWGAVGAVGGGALLAFIAFFVACTALARAKPKAPAALLVLAALFLPLVATGAGIYYGAGVLKKQTMAEAESFSGQIKIGNVDQALKTLQSGASFPGRDDLVSILNTVKEKAAEQGVAPQETDSQGTDQSGDQQDGSQDGSQDGAGQEGGDGQQGDDGSAGGEG